MPPGPKKMEVDEKEHAQNDEQLKLSKTTEIGSSKEIDSEDEAQTKPDDEQDSDCHEKKVLKPYVCDQCNKGFSRKYGLTRHKLIHDKNLTKLHVCDLCSKSFSRKDSLTDHKKTHAKKDKKEIKVPKIYVCDVCGKDFLLKCRLTRHKMIHSDNPKPFPCNVCGKGFSTASNLDQHKIMHSENPKPFVCNDCGKAYSNISNLKRHRINHAEISKPFICDHCNKNFSTKEYLSEHMICHVVTRSFVCEICSKCFRRRQELRIHIKVKHEGLRFKCDICEHTSVHPSAVLQHKKEAHENVRYKCEICEKFFNQYAGLWQHKRVVHENKRYECDLCGSLFRAKHWLKLHMEIHDVDRILECEDCPKKCISSRQLKYHMNNFHVDPVECERCRQQFRSINALKIHIKSVPCRANNCEENFVCASERIAHETEDHSYECKLCEQNLKTPQGFKTHNYVFHKEFKCRICGAILDGYKNYRGHMMKHEHFTCVICKVLIFGNKQAHEMKFHKNCRMCKKAFDSLDAVINCEKSHPKLTAKSIQDTIKHFPKNFFTFKNNEILVKVPELASHFEIDRNIPSSLSGNMSVTGSINEAKIFVVKDTRRIQDSAVLSLGPNVILKQNERNLTEVLIDRVIVADRENFKRPSNYFVYNTKVHENLKSLKVPRIPGTDWSHISASHYSHNQNEAIARNMHPNLCLMPSEFNRSDFWPLEKFLLFEATRRSNNDKDFRYMTREFILFHDKTSSHPLGEPNVILLSVAFHYKDSFELNCYVLPNVPLKDVFERYQITLRQFEEATGLYLLNETNFDCLKDREVHELEQYSDASISTNEIKSILALSKVELMRQPFVKSNVREQ